MKTVGSTSCGRMFTCWRNGDVLTQGVRIQLLGDLPTAPYFVYLSRAGDRPYTQVWAMQLAEPLATVPVPLLYPDPDVALDLQAALTACFELVGYERLLDYGGDLPGQVRPLRATGLGPAAARRRRSPPSKRGPIDASTNL